MAQKIKGITIDLPTHGIQQVTKESKQLRTLP